MKSNPRPGVSATNRAFDQLVPDELRHLSRTHCTPIERFASPRPPTGMCILDGGVGRMCVVGALSSGICLSGWTRLAPTREGPRERAALVKVDRWIDDNDEVMP